MGGYILKIRAGLPKFRDTEDKQRDLANLFSQILQKLADEDQNYVAISLQNMQNWTLITFLECLFSTIWEHFKSPTKDKPLFIGLCNPKSDEYKAANFHCHRLIETLMANVTGKQYLLCVF